MSCNDFITSILNIDSSKIKSLDTIQHSDTSIDVFITLNEEPVSYPYCHGKVNSHGYYQKKLTHSTLANRPCTIYYKQRRYRCRDCEFTFHENKPFALPNEHLPYETKYNVLTDLKFSHISYTYVAQKYHNSSTQVLRLFDTHVNIPRNWFFILVDTFDSCYYSSRFHF